MKIKGIGRKCAVHRDRTKYRRTDARPLMKAGSLHDEAIKYAPGAPWNETECVAVGCGLPTANGVYCAGHCMGTID